MRGIKSNGLVVKFHLPNVFSSVAYRRLLLERSRNNKRVNILKIFNLTVLDLRMSNCIVVFNVMIKVDKIF